MANNKPGDNHGVSRGDQEELSRLPHPRHRIEIDPHVKAVPRSALKPGRKYDKAAPAVREREENIVHDHAESELLGKYETNTALGSVSHKNE